MVSAASICIVLYACMLGACSLRFNDPEQNVDSAIKETMRKPFSVVDTVLFNGESDMLAIRLNELNSIVDAFLILEGTCSFHGEPKILAFDPQDVRLRKFRNKMVYKQMPCFNHSNSWMNEAAARNYAQQVFADTKFQTISDKSNTVIISSDVDEIPMANKLSNTFMSNDFANNIAKGKIYRVWGSFFYYNAKCISCTNSNTEKQWAGARIFAGKQLLSPHPFEDWRLSRDFTIGMAASEMPSEDTKNHCNKCIDLVNHGWHFSYFMSSTQIQHKLLTFSHTEFGKPPYVTIEHINEHKTKCKDLFDQKRACWRKLPELPLLPVWMEQAAKDGQIPSWFVSGEYEGIHYASSSP